QILNAINHDSTLATLATGTDADGNPTTGFVALPPATNSPAPGDVVATACNNPSSGAGGTGSGANGHGHGNDAPATPAAGVADAGGPHGAHANEHAAFQHFEHLWG